ncbi:hypothetical protein JTE90_024208 [Oedothorax gibbosus]|uniref:Uncharacterized protein n=1 Tax=Oedothorax gibbosus TaxID=931172 RepID=A0AAV6THH7_9ARAC|nr:hypothetical protein JTE90_024208 [Oedothorax gibbosus]
MLPRCQTWKRCVCSSCRLSFWQDCLRSYKICPEPNHQSYDEENKKRDTQKQIAELTELVKSGLGYFGGGREVETRYQVGRWSVDIAEAKLTGNRKLGQAER